MKVIFLLTKANKILIFVQIILIGILIFISIYVNNKNYDNLLLVIYQNETGGNVSIESLNEISNQKFLITYEQIENKMVKVFGVNHNVMVISTNYLYPHVLNLQVLKGGFFSKQLEDDKSKSVVLNELSAFELFGNIDVIGNEIDINNYNYTIVGVINDRDDENKNMYIPITINHDSVNRFIVNTKDRDSEYIINELNSLGISESSYNFIDIGLKSKIIQDKYMLAIELAMFVILIFVLYISVKGIFKQISLFKDESHNHYFKDIFINNPKVVIKFIFYLIFSSFLVGLLIYMLQQMLKKFLIWIENIKTIDYVYPNFYDIVSFINKFDLYTNIVFIIYLLCGTLILISLLQKE